MKPPAVMGRESASLRGLCSPAVLAPPCDCSLLSGDFGAGVTGSIGMSAPMMMVMVPPRLKRAALSIKRRASAPSPAPGQDRESRSLEARWDHYHHHRGAHPDAA